MEHKSIYQLVLAGILCAIGLVVPMVMPKVILGPMSFTLGSHVAIFLAMFISPKVVAAVVLGTTVGFGLAGLAAAGFFCRFAASANSLR